MNTHILVGKVLTGIQIASDKKAIQFMTTDGEVIARCDGDCCSDTWVESIECSVREFPATVTEADDIGMPDSGDECLAIYGFRIVTDKGHIIIDYRNESNGYYGGDLVWPGYRHYGGVHGQNESTCEWVSI